MRPVTIWATILAPGLRGPNLQGMKRIVLPVLFGLLIALPAWSRDVHALGLRAFQEVSDSYLIAFVDRMGTTLGCW